MVNGNLLGAFAFFDQFRAAVEEARNREGGEETDERERNREDEEWRIVMDLQTHGQLRGGRKFDMMNIFRAIINEQTNNNMQDFRNHNQPLTFQAINTHRNQSNVQILLAENGNHFCIAFHPNVPGQRTPITRAFNSINAGIAPDANQKAIARRMFSVPEFDVMSRWIPTAPKTYCPDGGTSCDCKEIFTLAYAILLVQGGDPEKFRFRLSDDADQTLYIRRKLLEMFREDQILMFDGDDDD